MWREIAAAAIFGLRDLATFGLVCGLPYILISTYILARVLLRERWEARVGRLPLSKQIPIWERDWNENGGIFRSFTRLW